MPMSNLLHLPAVLHFVFSVKPNRILDVGIGTGSYGFLMRQYLDISHERLKPSDWKVCIDGVEVFEAYRNPVWSYAYDNLFIGNILDIVDGLNHYDVILCNDVLEHFERQEAQFLVKKLLTHTSVLIATTPNCEYPQGEWGGNQFEEHRSLLDESDFSDLVVTKITGITSCYVCCSAKNNESLVATIKDASYTCPVSKPELFHYISWRINKKVERALFKFYTSFKNLTKRFS